MTLIKRTYALPDATLASFEGHVPAGQRSAMVAALMHDWLERQRRAKLRSEVAAGCAEMADLYLAIENEFHPLEEEVQRALEKLPAARGHRPRAPRSGRRVGASR